LQAFVDNSHGQKIKIAVFDEDKASDDESLGTLVSSVKHELKKLSYCRECDIIMI